MTNLLDGLIAEKPEASTPQATLQAPGAPDFSGAPPEFLQMLGEIAEGKLPGVFVPKGTKPRPNSMTPQDISALGIGIFRAEVDPNAMGVFFNPKEVSPAEVQKLDEAGKLSEVFPPVTDFVKAEPEEMPGATNAPATVPGLPRPTPGAPRHAAMHKPAAPVSPSKRQIPGGGTILNGLLPRAV